MTTHNFQKPKAITASVAEFSDTRAQDVISESSYAVQEQYRNFLSYPVVIIDINNNRVTVEPEARLGLNTPCLSIIRKHTWKPGVKLETNILSSEGEPPGMNANSAYQINHQKMTEKVQRSSYHRREEYLDIRLYENRFNQTKKMAFLRELGIVVTTPDILLRYNILNPLSKEAHILRNSHKDAGDPAPFIFRAFINVQPGHKYGERFININDRVYKIPAIVDETLPEGVYVTNNVEPEDEPYTVNGLLFQHIPLEEADAKLHLYEDIKSAKNHHATASRQAEAQLLETQRLLKEGEIEIQKLKAQNAKFAEQANMRKTETNIDYLVLSNKLKAELDALKARTEADSLSRKDSYESSHYSRKNSSEVVGWVPKIVAGVAGAVVAAVGVFAWFM